MELTRCDLTTEQQEKLLVILHSAEIYADHIRKVFRNHGFDSVIGSSLHIQIDPQVRYTTNTISFGRWDGNSGLLTITKGNDDDGYHAIGTNTKQLERLFEDGLPTEGKAERRDSEVPLPPDGLWISRFDDPCSVDSGV